MEYDDTTAYCTYYNDAQLETEQFAESLLESGVIMFVASVLAVALQAYCATRACCARRSTTKLHNGLSKLDVKVMIKRVAPTPGDTLHEKPQAHGGAATCAIIVLVIIVLTHKLAPSLVKDTSICDVRLQPTVQRHCGAHDPSGATRMCTRTPQVLLNSTALRIGIAVMDFADGRCKQRCGDRYTITTLGAQSFGAIRSPPLLPRQSEPGCVAASRCMLDCVNEPGQPVVTNTTFFPPELIFCSVRLLTGAVVVAASGDQGDTIELFRAKLGPRVVWFGTDTLLSTFDSLLGAELLSAVVGSSNAALNAILGGESISSTRVQDGPISSRAAYDSMLSQFTGLLLPLGFQPWDPYTRWGATGRELHLDGVLNTVVNKGLVDSIGLVYSCPVQPLQPPTGQPVVEWRVINGTTVGVTGSVLDTAVIRFNTGAPTLLFSASCPGLSSSVFSALASVGGFLALQPIMRQVFEVLQKLLHARPAVLQVLKVVAVALVLVVYVLFVVLLVILQVVFGSFALLSASGGAGASPPGSFGSVLNGARGLLWMLLVLVANTFGMVCWLVMRTCCRRWTPQREAATGGAASKDAGAKSTDVTNPLHSVGAGAGAGAGTSREAGAVGDEASQSAGCCERVGSSCDRADRCCRLSMGLAPKSGRCCGSCRGPSGRSRRRHGKRRMRKAAPSSQGEDHDEEVLGAGVSGAKASGRQRTNTVVVNRYDGASSDVELTSRQ